MKRQWLSILAALALCLGLLPGTAWAAGETGVEVVKGNYRVTLEAGKTYVADETNGGVKAAEDGETLDGYLSFDGSTLTVHGTVTVICTINVYSNLTITGEAGSSLDVTGVGPAFDLKNSAALTLDGGVNFTAQSSAFVVQSLYGQNNTLASEDSYSGKIVLKGTGDYAINMLVLDLQSSASIEITGKMIYYPCPDFITMKSKGDITITDAADSSPLPLLKAEGNNVTIESTESNPAYMGPLDITAKGNVEISSGGIPVNTVSQQYYPASLTVKGAQSVSITGKTDKTNSSAKYLFPVPVTFQNCGEATAADMGDGEILGAGGSITSDCFCTALNQDGEGAVVTPDGQTWDCEDITGKENNISVSRKKCWKAGEGWMFYEPAENGDPATLTLDNATYDGMLDILSGETHIAARGENRISLICGPQAVTVDESGGILNTVVAVGSEGSANITVYGKTELPYALSPIDLSEQDYQMTILPGAELTIPDYNDEGQELYIKDLTCFTNHGTIVNEGEVVLAGSAAENAGAETVKALGLTGGGKVIVRPGSQDDKTYTNEGKQLLAPAGTLDLSSDTDGDTDHWDTKGYTWEDVQTDENDNITSGTLILAEGFNAKTVKLPGNGADVTVKTLGDSEIGKLDYAGNTTSTSIHLTFEGGKLTINQQLNFSGANDSSVTVAEGAVVEVNGGVSVAASGGVDGTVTVNGTLTSRAESGPAVVTGKVSVGPSGKLEVYGGTGVQLGGINTGSGSVDFTGAFSLAPGGRFTGDCKNYIIFAQKYSGAAFEAGLNANDIIVIPDGYLPQGCEPGFNDNRDALTIPGGGPFNISSDNVPPKPGHTHAWTVDWTTSATHHWHECTASGCPAAEDSEKAGYGEHVYDDEWDEVCNICGYTRSLPFPEPPGGSGGSDDNDDSGDSGNRDTSNSSDSSVSSYAVTVERADHGKISSSHAWASGGSTVTLTVTPEEGYALDVLTVTDSRGNAVKLTEKSGRYTFTMPGRAVTVKGAFAPLPDGAETPCDGGASCPSRSFADLERGAWYHEAVDYVLERGLMGGYGNGLFGPDNSLSRAQFAQILYNQAGRPAVTGNAPFTDVAPDAWCAPAVAWAAEQGVVGGYGGGLFGPDDSITREQLAVMLWRYAGSPAAPDGDLAFTDAERIGAYAREALRWAVQTGVMNGKGGGVLDPRGPATRAQTASMLRNFLENG